MTRLPRVYTVPSLPMHLAGPIVLWDLEHGIYLATYK